MKAFDELMSLDPSSKYCVFNYCGHNLGDHIQTLAMLQHVRPKTLVYRDQWAPQKDLTLVANGWMTHGAFPSRDQFADVRYAGIHLDAKWRTPAVVDELRRSGIVGCRDTVTRQFLNENNVPNIDSRCATLTFPRYEGRREDIVCVDIDDKMLERVRWKYGRHGDVIAVTHTLPPTPIAAATPEQVKNEYRRAYELLQLYRKAKLVVTGRIHAALPSIAFGTPVIVVQTYEDRGTVFDGMGIPQGWKQFRWMNLLLRPGSKLPRPVEADIWRDRYVEFVTELLSGTARLGANCFKNRTVFAGGAMAVG